MAVGLVTARARLADAHWFPIDLDLPNGRVHFSELRSEQVDEAAFLDNRLALDWAGAERIPFAELADLPRVPAAPRWLWHTSFCGSTLLARMLHMPPSATVLREPLVLRRLSDAREAGIATEAGMRVATALLARPWHPGGQVVVKPTHAALNVARDLMTCTPGAPALVLTSSLDDFVVSHFKKTQQTLHNVGVLAARALRASPWFASRLAGEALAPPDVLCQAVVQWAAQRELVADLVGFAKGRVRVLDFADLLQSPGDVAVVAADWLGLDTPPQALREHAVRLSGVHAKAPTRQYDATAHAAEATHLRTLYAEDLERTLIWADRAVLPAMRAEARQPDATLDSGGVH